MAWSVPATLSSFTRDVRTRRIQFPGRPARALLGAHPGGAFPEGCSDPSCPPNSSFGGFRPSSGAGFFERAVLGAVVFAFCRQSRKTGLYWSLLQDKQGTLELRELVSSTYATCPYQHIALTWFNLSAQAIFAWVFL